MSPLFLYFMGFQNFLKLVGLAGGVFVGLESIFVVLMWRKASKLETPDKILNKIHPSIIYFLLLVFAIGIIYALLYSH